MEMKVSLSNGKTAEAKLIKSVPICPHLETWLVCGKEIQCRSDRRIQEMDNRHPSLVTRIDGEQVFITFPRDPKRYAPPV